MDLERELDRMRREEEIRCPFCDTLQTTDDNNYPVTYHGDGDESCKEMTCDECEQKFWVQEYVTRTYKVTKTYEELME